MLQAVKVNSFGKWKTALQMTSMSLLLFCKDQTGMMEEVFQGEAAGNLHCCPKSAYSQTTALF